MIRQVDGRLLIEGPVTMQTVGALLESGRALCRQDGCKQGWLVDFSGVTAVDSAALALVLAWMRAARERGSTLGLAHVPESLRALALLYDLQEILPLNGAPA